MLFTLPAVPSGDGFSGIPFPEFGGGFSPWDSPDPLFVFSHQQEPAVFPEQPPEPVTCNSDYSDTSKPKSVSSNSGSEEPSRNGPVEIDDERKRRRMLSNRESARRSRMRKQKHLENMRNQLNRLRIANRELMNRVRHVTQHFHLVRSDTDRLRSESAVLRQRLWDMRQVLLVRQLQQHPFSSVSASGSAWPCNNFTTAYEQNPPSLIT